MPSTGEHLMKEVYVEKFKGEHFQSWKSKFKVEDESREQHLRGIV